MIKFSFLEKTFYNTAFDYPSLPDDIVEVTDEQHMRLLNALNSGCVIFSDLTISAPKPSPFHTWDEGNLRWIDPRTDEEILQAEIEALPPLSAKDFRHMLDRAGMRTQIETMIENIADPTTKAAVKTEYEYAQFFERTNPVVIYMIGLLGMTDEQVNAEWKQPVVLDFVLSQS